MSHRSSNGSWYGDIKVMWRCRHYGPPPFSFLPAPASPSLPPSLSPHHTLHSVARPPPPLLSPALLSYLPLRSPRTLPLLLSPRLFNSPSVPNWGTREWEEGQEEEKKECTDFMPLGYLSRGLNEYVTREIFYHWESIIMIFWYCKYTVSPGRARDKGEIVQGTQGETLWKLSPGEVPILEEGREKETKRKKMIEEIHLRGR